MRLLKAIFIKRLNRFVVNVLLDGRITKCYLPNPGRLWELLLPGKTIYLKETKGHGLPYTVWATERKGAIICLHTHYTNDVAEKLIKNGVIFKEFRIEKKEISTGNHRIDFLIKRNSNSIFLEVKSCTLFQDEIAMFPDAVTERGKRHLEVLAENSGAILFIVHHPQAKYFLPDFHTDPAFSETLYRLKDRITVKAIAIKWTPYMDFQFIRELSIPWHIYEKEAKDRGSYILVGALKEPQEIVIGALGRLKFKKGYYLYTGSAMNSLISRIRRHLRKEKPRRWHIDYLIPYLEDIRAIAIRSNENLECSISESLTSITDDYVKDFGCSDCNCESHLYWMKNKPFNDERFIDIILRYRIERLKAFL